MVIAVFMASFLCSMALPPAGRWRPLRASGQRLRSDLLAATGRKDGKSPPRHIDFVNLPITNRINEGPVKIKDENDLRSFLRDVGGYMVQLEDGTNSEHRSFEDLVEGKKHVVIYKERRSADDRFHGFIDNMSRGFEDRAILGVVRQLEYKGHTGVFIAFSHQKVSEAGSKDTLTDFDGIVQTDSHIFVIEAKMHAKVPAICV